MFPSLDPRSVPSDDVIQREHKCLRSRRPLDPAKDAQRGASPTFENAAHLIQSLSLVWKKLQSELAEDNIKAVREEWQIESAALNPSDRSSLRRRTSGDSQHPGVQVEASHQPSTDSFRRQTRHNAGPASDVQNRFSLPRLRAVHDILCPRQSLPSTQGGRPPFTYLCTFPQDAPAMGRDRRPAWWSGGVGMFWRKKSVSPLINGR